MFTVSVMRNISYANRKECMLDYYLPQTEKPVPLLLFFHGGGLETGERQDETVLYTLAAKYGIAVATADYRLYPHACYPDFIADAADAARAVQDYGAQHRCFSHYYIGGESAGAYLAMMLFFSGDFFAKRDLKSGDFAGYIFDAGQPTTHFRVLQERGLDSRMVRVDDAAPLYYLNRDFKAHEQQPRLLLMVSDDDMPGRLEQNRLLYSTLNQFGYDMSRVDFQIMEGYPHCGYYDAIDSFGDYLLMKRYAEFILNYN